jgi:hypothetical protein
VILAVSLILGLGAGGCAGQKSLTNATGDSFPKDRIESLAKALTTAGAKEYGSQYCSACELQKEMFGSAWQYINFIECSLDASETQNAACRAAGITLYPTWELKDGSRLQGVQQLEVLAQKIGFSF